MTALYETPVAMSIDATTATELIGATHPDGDAPPTGLHGPTFGVGIDVRKRMVSAFDAPPPPPPPPLPAPALRPWRERFAQTVLFELLALGVAVPLYAVFTDTSPSESTSVLIAVSIAVTTWTALHNLVFDRWESQLRNRSASDRPIGLRVFHAITHEVTAAVVSVPVLVIFGGLSWATALTADIALSVLYAALAFGYYAAYDAVRPVDQPLRNG